MKRFAFSIFGALVLSCIALMGCPSKSSTPTSPGGGGSNGPTNTPTETAICNPSYTFGKSAVGGSSSSFSGGDLFMNEFTLSATGNVYRLHADIPAAPSAGASVQMAIYTNNAGAPQSLLAQSAVLPAVQGWETFDIPATVLAAGSYWIGLISNSTGVPLAYDNGGATDTKYAGTSPGSLPTALSGLTNSNWDFSYYADYCVNGSSPTPIPTITLTFTPTSTPTNTITFTQTPSSCAGIFSFGTNFTGDTTREVDNGTFASSYSLPVTGKVTQLHAYVVTTNSANAQLGLYSNGASGPGTLITESNSLSVHTGWNSFPVPGTALLPPGTYWIAAANPAGGTGPVFSAIDTTGGANASDGAGTLSVLPSPYGASGGNGINLSLYADYCVPIGSPTPLPSPTLTFTTTATPTSTVTNTQTPACVVAYSFGRNYQGVTTIEIDNGSNASKFTLPVSGIVSELHAYVTTTNGASLQMGLYSNSGSAPGTLISGSNPQAAVVGWNNLAIPNTPLLLAGTYWIEAGNASAAPGPSFALDDATINSDPSDGYSSFSVNPATYSGSGPFQMSYSFYADYCVPGSSPTPAPSLTKTPTVTSTPTSTPTVTQTPACLSPTVFGKNTTGTDNTFGGGYSLLTRFVLSSGPVTVIRLHVNVSSESSATNARMALYDDNSGAPHLLKTQSNTLPVTVGWNTFPVPGVVLSAPATYWIGVVHDNNGVGLGISDYTAGATSDGYENYGSVTSWPATFPTGGSAWNNTLSVYADKCP